MTAEITTREEETMISTRVQLTEEQSLVLQEMAAREQVSVAELVQRAINNLLQSETASLEERCQRAIAAVGRFHSGINDLAERHDEYLAEVYGERAE
jgi:hypothetical protein